MVVGAGFEPAKVNDRQIYSLHPLATWISHQQRKKNNLPPGRWLPSIFYPKKQSKQPSLVKTVEAEATRIGRRLPDDHVVEQVNADRAGGFPQLAGHLQVG